VFPALAACAGLALAAPVALALGGDDTDPVEQVESDTEICQAEIAKRGARGWAADRAKALSACLDAIMKCDERPSPETATACRAALAVPGSGRCAHGKLDVASTVGPGAAAAAVTAVAGGAKSMPGSRLRRAPRSWSTP
jgi:hypothetical protein